MDNPTIKSVPGSLELLVTHRFNAPIDLVYRIYTDPKYIPEWWGPRDLITTVDKMEVKPGGIWRYIQRDKQNNTFAFHGVYHSLEPNKRIISTFEWEGVPGHVIFVTTDFAEKDGITTIMQQDLFQSIEDRDGMIQTGMEKGMREGDERFNELLERLRSTQPLGEKLAHQPSDEGNITITRIFNAPPERVWQEWTNPDLYMCWWGPKDYYAPFAQFDLHVGGRYLSSMRGPDGKDVWSTGVYKEIIEPRRIVMSDSFADEKGNIVPATYYGMGNDFPDELEVEVTLEDIGGQTRLTLEHCGLPTGAILEQAREGWNESLDKLSECLQRA